MTKYNRLAVEILRRNNKQLETTNNENFWSQGMVVRDIIKVMEEYHILKVAESESKILRQNNVSSNEAQPKENKKESEVAVCVCIDRSGRYHIEADVFICKDCHERIKAN